MTRNSRRRHLAAPPRISPSALPARARAEAVLASRHLSPWASASASRPRARVSVSRADRTMPRECGHRLPDPIDGLARESVAGGTNRLPTLHRGVLRARPARPDRRSDTDSVVTGTTLSGSVAGKSPMTDSRSDGGMSSAEPAYAEGVPRTGGGRSPFVRQTRAPRPCRRATISKLGRPRRQRVEPWWGLDPLMSRVYGRGGSVRVFEQGQGQRRGVRAGNDVGVGLEHEGGGGGPRRLSAFLHGG